MIMPIPADTSQPSVPTFTCSGRSAATPTVPCAAATVAKPAAAKTATMSDFVMMSSDTNTKNFGDVERKASTASRQRQFPPGTDRPGDRYAGTEGHHHEHHRPDAAKAFTRHRRRGAG